jgi:hypothetical protein
MFFRRYLLISAALVCGTTSYIRAQQTAPIPASFTRDYVFPPVGLGGSETASITVVNIATVLVAEPGLMQPTTPPSCTGTISFFSANGAIGTPASFTVGEDQFKTVTLPFASAGLTGTRGEIQGKVSLTSTPSAPTRCSLTFSMETYDSTTGATHSVMSNTLAPELFWPSFPPIVLPGGRP